MAVTAAMAAATAVAAVARVAGAAGVGAGGDAGAGLRLSAWVSMSYCAMTWPSGVAQELAAAELRLRICRGAPAVHGAASLRCRHGTAA